MPEFDFCAPTTVATALELLNDDALVMSGGTILGLLLREGLVDARRLVWLGRITRLRDIKINAEGILEIGASVTLSELARSPVIRAEVPVIARVAGLIGNPRVRAVATIGGHLGASDPRQDLLPVLLVLGATVVIAGRDGERRLPVADLFAGHLETTLRSGEFVTGVEIPRRLGHCTTYLRFCAGSDDDYPTIGAAAALERGPDGRVTHAAVGLAGAATVPILVPNAGRLVGRVPVETDLSEVAAGAKEAANPSSDHRGSANYKREMAAVWTRRVLLSLLH